MRGEELLDLKMHLADVVRVVMDNENRIVYGLVHGGVAFIKHPLISDDTVCDCFT